MRIKSRLEALERRSPTVMRWHEIIVDEGDTLEAARARYEASNGPIGADEGLLVREIVSPA